MMNPYLFIQGLASAKYTGLARGWLFALDISHAERYWPMFNYIGLYLFLSIEG